MPKIIALHSFRAGKGSKLILQGQTTEVSDEFAAVLISRGIAKSAEPVDDSGQGTVTDQDDLDDGDQDAEPVDDADDESEKVKSSYPALPLQAAPVAEWEAYAKKYDINLTGLKNRNEKTAFITKVVNGE